VFPSGNNLLLTVVDLKELKGRVQPAAQLRWLHRSGWRFTVNALGHPVVAVAEFERRMVGGNKPIRNQEPNWSAIDGSQA
jgi:Domain of unknown function (DUF4224)